MSPALFIAHGSPMNALGDNAYSDYLGELGRALPKPSGILALSAHWETPGTQLLDLEQPATIHDFFGFPPELYKIEYPARGAPKVRDLVTKLLGASVSTSRSWGFDHGVWAVLRFLFPRADIPVAQLSLNKSLSLRQHYELATQLRSLRDQNILVIGSGNIVHNLRDFSWSETTEPFAWAVEFDRAIAKALTSRDLDVLLDFKGIEPELVRRLVPTPEHYVPLVYALGVSDPNDPVSYPFTAMQNGSIAMRSVRFG